jgi:hypothetical protein
MRGPPDIASTTQHDHAIREPRRPAAQRARGGATPARFAAAPVGPGPSLAPVWHGLEPKSVRLALPVSQLDPKSAVRCRLRPKCRRLALPVSQLDPKSAVRGPMRPKCVRLALPVGKRDPKPRVRRPMRPKCVRLVLPVGQLDPKSGAGGRLGPKCLRLALPVGQLAPRSRGSQTRREGAGEYGVDGPHGAGPAGRPAAIP